MELAKEDAETSSALRFILNLFQDFWIDVLSKLKLKMPKQVRHKEL
jgi:hypothetical protein